MRSQSSCDYIVVGADPAGCVVAVPCRKSGHGSVERMYLGGPRKEFQDPRRIMKSKSNICRQQSDWPYDVAQLARSNEGELFNAILRTIRWRVGFVWPRRVKGALPGRSDEAWAVIRPVPLCCQGHHRRRAGRMPLPWRLQAPRLCEDCSEPEVQSCRGPFHRDFRRSSCQV